MTICPQNKVLILLKTTLLLYFSLLSIKSNKNLQQGKSKGPLTISDDLPVHKNCHVEIFTMTLRPGRGWTISDKFAVKPSKKYLLTVPKSCPIFTLCVLFLEDFRGINEHFFVI